MLLQNQEIKDVKYSQFNLLLRSLIFITYTSVAIFFYSFVCLFTIPFPLSYRYAFVRAFLKVYMAVLKFVCHLDYQVEGLENIPKDRVGVILCKHSSTFETFLLPILFHDPAPIAKRELVWIPFFGWGLAVADPILINRGDKKSAMQQIIEKGKKCLQAGRWIMFFPEGTRVPYGTVGQYKLGGTRLAVATGCPIIPIAHNAGRYWPRRKLIKTPGTIKVVIGPVIESVGRSPEELLEQAKTWIEGTMKTL